MCAEGSRPWPPSSRTARGDLRPPGLGRSTTRRDGRTDQTPEDQAADLHALVEHLGAGPVDVFASSGGAVAALTRATVHPGDLATIVAHEPPVMWALPDAEAAARASGEVASAYAERRLGAGMAASSG
jgi:pimeloyl-ACP methyl ester carboxylesterase